MILPQLAGGRAIPPSVLRRHALFPLAQRCCLFSSTSTVGAALSSTVSPNPHFMVEYLMNYCGSSAAEASKAAKSLAHLQSTKKPDAVLSYMKSQGLDGVKLRRMVAYKPSVLCWDVEKTLAPKFRFFRDLGLSESDLVDVVVANPIIISYNIHRFLIPKLKIWESLFGSKEFLLKNLKKKCWFLSNSVERVVRPNLNFLQGECGIPEKRVSLVLRRNPTFIVQTPDSLRALVLRAEELGASRQSGMFIWILNALHNVSKEKFESHAKLMKCLGWLDSEFSTAIKKQPNFIGVSPGLLKRKMEFLVKEVGFTPSYVAHNPTLLLLSLEKRVIPRFHVMERLRSNGLWTEKSKLLAYFLLSNENFMAKFILLHKEKVPELQDILCVVKGREGG